MRAKSDEANYWGHHQPKYLIQILLWSLLKFNRRYFFKNFWPQWEAMCVLPQFSLSQKLCFWKRINTFFQDHFKKALLITTFSARRKRKWKVIVLWLLSNEQELILNKMNKTEDVLEETLSNTFAPNNVNSSWKTNGTTTWQLPQESSLLSDALGKIHWHGNLGAEIFLLPKSL